MKEDDRVKRATNRQFMCYKCSCACLKSIGHRNVSFFASMHHKALRPLQCFEFLKMANSYPDEKEKSNIARKKEINTFKFQETFLVTSNKLLEHENEKYTGYDLFEQKSNALSNPFNL